VCGGHTMASMTTLDSSQFLFHPSAVCVLNGHLIWRMRLFFFPLSFFISKLTMQKIKVAFHFIISLYLAHVLFITIYFIRDGL